LFSRRCIVLVTRGVRGAIGVEEDSPGSIVQATHELLRAILAANPSLCPPNLASVLFTMTDDLTSAYPALAARQLGWVEVPLICAREIAVPGGMPRVIRVLLHWNTEMSQSDIHHVYLGRAVELRPDLASLSPATPYPLD
jgi:chorismate mutase